MCAVPKPSPPMPRAHSGVFMCVHARRARRVRAEGPWCTPRGRCLCAGQTGAGAQASLWAAISAPQGRVASSAGLTRVCPGPSGTVGGLRDTLQPARAPRAAQPQHGLQKRDRPARRPLPFTLPWDLAGFPSQDPTLC